MSIKSKIKNMITSHPKLVTLGIGLAITFASGTAMGMILDPDNMVSAFGLVPCVNHPNQWICTIN
jgi:hypothetical protein